MLKFCFTSIVFIVCFQLNAQTLPDSIIVRQNLYMATFGNEEDTLYSSTETVIKNKNGSYFLSEKKIKLKDIYNLLEAIKAPQSFDKFFNTSGIDTISIRKNPKKLLKNSKDDFIWNKQQLDFILPKLSNIENYKYQYKKIINQGGYRGMHSNYLNQYIIAIYSNGKIVNRLTSRKLAYGAMSPWKDDSGEEYYDANIDNFITIITANKRKYDTPHGKRLLKQLSEEIINQNSAKLYNLSAYTYYNEIQELNSDFEINNFSEVRGRGRYISNAPEAYQISLKNKKMLPNVYIQFIASAKNKKLYSRDSIKTDYEDIVNRVQSINFISDYLSKNKDTKLDIYYFNNKAINDYNIDGINKNPEEWAKHDQYLEGMKRYDSIIPKPSFANEEAIKTSERIYCGCNLRLNKSFLEKAIFFEINDEEGNSVWFLLPDNRVLLYIMEGDRVLNYNYDTWGNEYTGIQFPCKLFDINGMQLN